MAATCDSLLFVLILLMTVERSAIHSHRLRRADGDAAFCTNPTGQAGTCINIKNCPMLIDMLRQQRQLPGVAEFLRASACGYEGRDPKVCCPSSDNVPPEVTVPETSPASLNRETVELPDLSVCGITGPEVKDRRVVGGYPAELGAWPWIVVLGYKSASTSEIKFLCGGVLITRRHVITAGHCVHNRKDLYLARVGDLDLKKTDDGATPQEILIEDRKIHEQYNPTTFVNDIAILRLARDVKFTSLIKPICLPLAPEIRSRDFVRHFPYIAGWGAVRFNGPSSSHLLQLQIPVVSQSSCKDAFKKFNTATIDDRVLCAGYAMGGKDACQGDSGGPLMWPSGEHFYLIGIVSYGFRCAEPGFPGVYTRVTVFLDWINSHLI